MTNEPEMKHEEDDKVLREGELAVQLQNYLATLHQEVEAAANVGHLVVENEEHMAAWRSARAERHYADVVASQGALYLASLDALESSREVHRLSRSLRGHGHRLLFEAWAACVWRPHSPEQSFGEWLKEETKDEVLSLVVRDLRWLD